MRSIEAIIPEIGYFLIAAAGGLLRYLSNILGGKMEYSASAAIIRIVCSGLLGILAGWVAPVVTDVANYQQAIVYVSGMLSIEIIKIIINRIPDIINRQIDKGKNGL